MNDILFFIAVAFIIFVPIPFAGYLGDKYKGAAVSTWAKKDKVLGSVFLTLFIPVAIIFVTTLVPSITESVVKTYAENGWGNLECVECGSKLVSEFCANCGVAQ